ncbi:MAG TPA: hypothetical protein VI643_06650 [Planctomycetota bacterium]|nr:hypothetical protein [Planctomycetota bacterium]
MDFQECKSCGFKVMTDGPIDASKPWLCPLCEGKAGSSNGAEVELPPIPQDLLPDAPPVENFAPAPSAPPPIVRPPRGLTRCPTCSGMIKVVEEQYGRHVKCPLCQQSLAVSETGELDEYDEFKDYLKHRAQENRQQGIGARSRTGGGRATGSRGEPEDDGPREGLLAAIPLYFVILAPFLTGLLVTGAPGVIKKIERILAKILPLIS